MVDGGWWMRGLGWGGDAARRGGRSRSWVAFAAPAALCRYGARRRVAAARAGAPPLLKPAWMPPL